MFHILIDWGINKFLSMSDLTNAAANRLLHGSNCCFSNRKCVGSINILPWTSFTSIFNFKHWFKCLTCNLRADTYHSHQLSFMLLHVVVSLMLWISNEQHPLALPPHTSLPSCLCPLPHAWAVLDPAPGLPAWHLSRVIKTSPPS